MELNNTLKFDDIVKLIVNCGKTNTIMVRGQPGVGKSSLLKEVAKLTGLHPVYIDCPVTDLPEIGMPVVENGRTFTALHEQWCIGTPCVYLLDEISKAMGPAKLTFTRFMLERNIAGYDIHPDSIIIGTGNLTTDGVGDTMQGHINNRISTVLIQNPTSEEWIQWGLANGINALVLATVDQLPHMLASYTDKQQDSNPYIYNPKTNTTSFTSPRSLALVSKIVDKREQLGDDICRIAMSGTIGASAAADMAASFSIIDKLPKRESIYKDPKNAPIPSNVAAQLLLIFGMIASIDKQNATPMCEYLVRFTPEMFTVFVRNVMGIPDKRSLAMQSPIIQKWAVENMELLG